jgi:hypothetical protein
MLPFGVTIPATVPQGSDIPEGLMNYPVFSYYITAYIQHNGDVSLKNLLHVSASLGLLHGGHSTKKNTLIICYNR